MVEHGFRKAGVMGSSPVIGCMNFGEFCHFIRNRFRSQGGDTMVKRMLGLLLRLFVICLGLLIGVIFFTGVEVGRGDCLVPYGLVLIFGFGLVFIQFFVLAIVRLVINKIFNLHLGQGVIRYFLIAFVYSVGYGVIVDFVSYKIIDNDFVMLGIIPILVFLAIVAVEMLLDKYKNKKITSL